MAQPRIAPRLVQFRVHFEIDRDGQTIRDHVNVLTTSPKSARDHVAKSPRLEGCRIVKTKRIREETRS